MGAVLHPEADPTHRSVRGDATRAFAWLLPIILPVAASDSRRNLSQSRCRAERTLPDGIAAPDVALSSQVPIRNIDAVVMY